MTENFFAALEPTAPEVAPEVENTDPQTVLWHKTQAIIEQVKSSLSDGEHDITPLLDGIADARVRDALLMYVVTEGNEDVMRGALGEGDSPAVGEALDTIVYGPDGPNDSVDEALRYLEDVVYPDPAASEADNDVKANLYALAAVLAFWKNDETLIHRCIDGANASGGNRLASLVSVAVTRGIRPAWVTQ